MKGVSVFLFVLLLSSNFLFGQTNKPKQEKLVLTCPFEHGSGREPKEAFTWDSPDLKVILISKVDSVVRSCIKATVVKVEPAEEGYHEVVINVNDFYFWYYGLFKPIVTRGQTVNAGQSIGIYKLGTELEFRMFKFEDMQDPRELLECKVLKAE